MKNKTISLLNLLLIFSAMVFASTSVTDLTCEYHTNPIGIDVEQPRFNWKLTSDKNNVLQTAYEIRVASSLSALKKGKDLLWSTGKQMSNQSVGVVFEGTPLKSMQRAYWQVRVWDNDNKASAWSTPAYWEMGLLDTKDWKASWITMPGSEYVDKSLPSQYYRSEFLTSKPISSARVYVSSLGLYQLYINGEKVGDQLFTPGFTSYNKRIQYQAYDVTDMLQANNAIGAIVGDGWYRGRLGWDGGVAYYGKQLGLIAQLQITYTDGTTETILTDENWKTSYGAILESDIYDGEKYDARLEKEGWCKANFKEKWSDVSILDHSKDILVASNGIPVRATEEITPIKIITTPKGEKVLDLGQNIVGWVRMKVKGNAGDQVTLQFAEVLDKEGNFFTTNLRSAEATDIYTLKGGEEEVFEPHFTFHGFRFIKLQNYPGELTTDKITGVVIHSDMTPTGDFSCSDPLITQLQKNIQWGQRDNFLDIPTDCPQRDERVGWTGDAQVFAMTAAFNFDVAAFYTKWLRDLALDQQPNGEVPNIIPDMWNNKMGGTTGWGDAAVIIPWTVYRNYGDTRILEQQYSSMKGWVDYLQNSAGDDYLWNERHWHWGDWLSYHSDKPDYPGAFTEKDLIATAYYKYSTSLLSKTAAVLGNDEDAAKYAALSEKVKAAFIQEYMTPNGRLVSHTQTAYALALSFDLIPETHKKQTAKYFADDVRKFKHLTTGFLGTPLLCSTLTANGYEDLAYMLLNRKEYPGWLYPVTQGATTIWERWDTQKPDGSIIEGMNSFNHYAYGAIGEWLYNYVAGINLDEENPAYKNIIFAPHIGGGLTSAKAEVNSVYGPVSSSWLVEDNNFVYNITIPANSTATVNLPKSKNKEVTIQSLPIKKKGIKMTKKEANDVIVELGSGSYQVSYQIK